MPSLVLGFLKLFWLCCLQEFGVSVFWSSVPVIFTCVSCNDFPLCLFHIPVFLCLLDFFKVLGFWGISDSFVCSELLSIFD